MLCSGRFKNLVLFSLVDFKYFSMLLSVTLTVLLSLAAALQVDLSPRKALFKVGNREELKCSMNECPEDVKFSWISLDDKPLYAAFKISSNESVMIFNSVTKDHENIIQCKARCKDKTKQATANVKVYSFAKDPVISGHDSLMLGVENTLTCKVADVHPPEDMTVVWLRGGTVVHTEEGVSNIQTVHSTYTFTPLKGDNGEQITCQASLLSLDLPPDQRTRKTSVSMTILSPPSGVTVSGSTTVPVGSALALSCKAEGRPEPDFSWMFFRADGQRVRVAETWELSLTNVSFSDAGTYECEASNGVGKETATVVVTVHGPPTNTVISVSHNETKEYENVSISCVSDSVPQSHLTLSKLVNGAETELGSEDGPEISMSFLSASINDSGLYTCKASNVYGNQSASIQLTIQTHPLQVTLHPAKSIITVERGSDISLSCEASGCPHPHFSWKSLQDKFLQSQTDTQLSISQINLGPVGPNDEGDFICEVVCGSVVKSKRTELKIFSFPSHPTVKSSGPSLEGEITNLTCTVHDVFPASHFCIQWLDGETELSSETWTYMNGLQDLSSTFSFQPDGVDQEKTITCKVTLEMDDVPASEKSVFTTLTIHYPPRQTTIIVSPMENLKEGEFITFYCMTESFPEGRVLLKKVLEDEQIELVSNEGKQTSFSISFAEMADSGIYVCEAINEYGSQRASAQIAVQAPPRNTTVKVLPSTQVLEGQNITICCQSVSIPPPAIILRKLDSGIDIYSPNGTFMLVNLTPNDTGIYQVNVTNALGYQTEIFTIQVKERRSSPPPTWNILITPFIGLGILTSVAFVLEYLRRARLKGFYELSKCKPGTV
ncbi:vascular cell adhesion protein 1b [Hoplias malabaricus]|uniref:vascular cell adhesion protein 1b n=1 Tax=Hoplias malabaricus TaxID=27720 RepID=UPI003462A362